jgi:hypothetical protein
MSTGRKAAEDVDNDLDQAQATNDIQKIALPSTTNSLNLERSPAELDGSDSMQQIQATNFDAQDDDPMTHHQQQQSSLLLSVVPNKDLYATSTGELSRDSTVGTSNTKKETDGSSTMVTTPQSGKIAIESAVSSYSNTTADFFHDMSSSSNTSSNSGNGGDSVFANDNGNGGSADVMGIGCCNTFDSILTVTNELPMDKHSGHRSSYTPTRSKHRSSHSRKVSTSQHDKHHQIIDPSAVLNFAMEHRIFLKAALNLISELDRTAPQLGMMDPIVLKAGSLKKASHLMNGVWKVKYVEIRRGMFSYYENAVSNVNSNSNRTDRGNTSSANHSINNNEIQGELLRKNIPLEASTCTCRAVKLHQKALNFSPSGAIFELSTTTTIPRKGMNNNSNNSHNTNSNNTNNNNTTTTIKRLWMASSRAERQAWMYAINNAMVGGSVTRGDSFLLDHTRNGGGGRSTIRTSPYKDDIRKYNKQQSILRSAKTSSEYLSGLRELLNHPLHIPIAWIRKQSTLSPHDSNSNNNNFGSNINNNNNSSSSNNYAFYESTVELSVDQLRRDLLRDSVSINGIIYRGDHNHGPERIFGALTRCIMNVGHTTVTSSSSSNRNTSSSSVGASHLHHHHHHQSSSDLRESKALMYTRDILLAGNRTRSGGDSYFCVETLCSNSELVVLVPSGKAVQPVEITVTEDDSDDSLRNRFNDKSDWIRTKSKLQRSWRRHYVVLSEGMLSYYEGATPRPHGLRGQQSLVDAVISITKKKSKVTSNLIDVNHDEYIVSISLKEGNTKDRLLLFESETKLLDWVYALECVTRAKPSTEMTRKLLRRRLSSSELEPNSTANSMTSILSSAQHATMDHALKIGLHSDLVAKRLKNIDHHAACDVRVSVSALTEYKVCTVNPQGDEEQDTWANIQSHFLQSFRISGGSAGRILRGEEVVRFTVLNCLDPMPSNPGTEGTLSPTSTMRSRINRRIFRNTSTDHDLIEVAVPPSSGVSD